MHGWILFLTNQFEKKLEQSRN